MNSPVRTPGDLVVTRSLMFVPGSKQRMIDKSVAMRNLDVAMYDIEDGVAPEGVPEAIVRSWTRARESLGVDPTLRRAQRSLSVEDLATVRARVDDGACVIGLRFTATGAQDTVLTLITMP